MSLPPWELALDCEDGPRQGFEHPGLLEWTGELDWRERNRGVRSRVDCAGAGSRTAFGRLADK
jgi:hypothetical protein